MCRITEFLHCQKGMRTCLSNLWPFFVSLTIYLLRKIIILQITLIFFFVHRRCRCRRLLSFHTHFEALTYMYTYNRFFAAIFNFIRGYTRQTLIGKVRSRMKVECLMCFVVATADTSSSTQLIYIGREKNMSFYNVGNALFLFLPLFWDYPQKRKICNERDIPYNSCSGFHSKSHFDKCMTFSCVQCFRNVCNISRYTFFPAD